VRALCCVCTCLAFVVAGCDRADEVASRKPANEKELTPSLNLKHGTYGGVALGDTIEQMHRVFGPKELAGEGEPVTALAVGNDLDYSPHVLTPARELGPGTIGAYRYEYVVFMVSGARIDAIIVNDPNARAPGVGIGDDLEQARARHGLRCGTANENTEYEPYPACMGRTAPQVYAWFGGDPIRNVTLSVTKPGGI
jgi:hypothetical protein